MNKYFQNLKYLKKIYNNGNLIKFRGNFLKKYSINKQSTRSLTIKLLQKITNKNILDIGCGNCSFVKKLHKLYQCNNYYGLDIVKHPSCCNLKFLNYKLYDGKKFPKYRNKFDIILCMHTLYHIGNFKFIFNWIKKILNKEGILIITTKSKHTLPKIEMKFLKIIKQMNLDKIIHITRYRDEERFCLENGSKILKKYFPSKYFHLKKCIIENNLNINNKPDLIQYIFTTQRYNPLNIMRDDDTKQLYQKSWQKEVARTKIFKDKTITVVYVLFKKYDNRL